MFSRSVRASSAPCSTTSTKPVPPCSVTSRPRPVELVACASRVGVEHAHELRPSRHVRRCRSPCDSTLRRARSRRCPRGGRPGRPARSPRDREPLGELVARRGTTEPATSLPAVAPRRRPGPSRRRRARRARRATQPACGRRGHGARDHARAAARQRALAAADALDVPASRRGWTPSASAPRPAPPRAQRTATARGQRPSDACSSLHRSALNAAPPENLRPGTPGWALPVQELGRRGGHAGADAAAEVALDALRDRVRAAVRLEALEVEAEPRARAPTGAGRRGGPGPRAASRASPRSGPGRPAASAAAASTRARGCFETTGKWRNTRCTGSSLEDQVRLGAVGALEVGVLDHHRPGAADVVVRARAQAAVRWSSASKMRFAPGTSSGGDMVGPLRPSRRADHHERAAGHAVLLRPDAVGPAPPRPSGGSRPAAGSSRPRWLLEGLVAEGAVDRDADQLRARAPRARRAPPGRRSAGRCRPG